MQKTNLTQPTSEGTQVAVTPEPGDDTSTSGTPLRRAKRRPAGSGFDRQSGRRPLKEYPLTKGEMDSLAAIGLGATLCFSGAAGTFGFWVNVSMSMAMSGQIPDAVKAAWETYKTISIVACPLLFLGGCFFLWWGNSRVGEIMAETSHD